MNAIGDVLAGMVQKSLQNQEPGDYFDDEGFLCCGNCHERKQMDVTLPAVPSIGRDAKTIRVGCLCKCGQEKADAEKADRERREFEQRMDRLRRDGITDPAYLQYTFAQDDQRNPKVSDVCRRYVENWEEMKAQNIGILFYGDVGTGKSFLGVERDTSYSVEQVYNVVDTRARSGKPVIITTNLSLKDLENPPSLAYKRIYDRVLEMCPIRLKMVGASRRTANATDRRDAARRILGLTKGQDQ